MPTNFKVIVKDNDIFGRDLYRASIAGVPLGFQPTLEHVVRQSANKNNNNTTIEAISPIVRLVDGLAVSTDAYKASFKFTALQHVEDDKAADLVIDAVLAYIGTHRATIKAGLKPTTATTIVVGP